MPRVRCPYSSPLLFFAFSLLAGMAFFVFPFVFAGAQGGGGGMGGGPDDDKGGEAHDPIISPEPLPDITPPLPESPPPERTPPDSFPAPAVSPFCVNETESYAIISWDSAAYGTQGVHVQVDDDGDWGNGFWWDIAAPSENTREVPEDNGRPMNVAQPPFRRLILNPEQTYYVRIYSLEWARLGPEVSFTAACAVPPSPFTLACSAAPLEPTSPDTITWSVGVSGGAAPFTYQWSGADGLSGNAASVNKTYITTGTKEGTVVVTASDGGQKTCTQSLFVWPPEGIVAEPFCAGSESKADISWRTAGSFGDSGFFVDVDDDTDWGNGFWNKFIPAGTHQTVAPDGFNLFGGAAGPLEFSGGARYRARVYYVSGDRHTPVSSFDALACAEPPPPPPPPPPPVPPDISFIVEPSLISSGGQAELVWSAANVVSCSINRGIGSVSFSGSEPVRPSQTTTYTFSCIVEDGGLISREATVQVRSAPQFQEIKPRTRPFDRLFSPLFPSP